jgi:putative FmdB family regulatory protein
MPIYEYKCQQCGTHIEKRQNISDQPLTKCEECGGKLEKQWSRTGFQFKGDGWYVTDYASKGSGKSEKSSTESTGSSDGASKETADSKSTAKGESGSQANKE